jgi:hypothetical protein
MYTVKLADGTVLCRADIAGASNAGDGMQIAFHYVGERYRWVEACEIVSMTRDDATVSA